jgi:DNA-binding PadR family transcriptional regulator
MLELLKELLGVEGYERAKPYVAVLGVLEVFADEGPCLSYQQIFKAYRRGGRGYLKQVLKELEDKGFIERIDGNKYRLTVKGYAVTQRDPPRPKLFLAGADVALKAAKRLKTKPLNWLLSAGRYWSGERFKRSKDFRLARFLGGLLFLDSGAQQFYRKFRGLEYPYTAKQYIDFAVKVRADLIATLDLPLDLLVPKGLCVEKGLKRTVELGVEVISLAESMGILEKVVPVLQGYDDPSQWLECLDMYGEHGVTPQKFAWWGLGSLCVMRSTRLVEKVIREVKGALRTNKVHVFGIGLNALKRVYSLVDSYDTSAWVYWAKMDGAVLVWSSWRRGFIHMQARDGKRYSTEDLMEVNLKNLLEMHEDLSLHPLNKVS